MCGEDDLAAGAQGGQPATQFWPRPHGGQRIEKHCQHEHRGSLHRRCQPGARGQAQECLCKARCSGKKVNTARRARVALNGKETRFTAFTRIHRRFDKVKGDLAAELVLLDKTVYPSQDRPMVQMLKDDGRAAI